MYVLLYNGKINVDREAFEASCQKLQNRIRPLTINALFKISGLLQPVDERLINKIQELVLLGVNRVSEMQRHLEYYVKKELLASRKPPEATNRRFFPANVDVRNHMYRATLKNKHSSFDQENLELKIKEWEKESPEDNFFFRPY